MADLKESGIALLAGPITVNLAAAATTEVTLYTVPVGKRCILDHIKLVAGATASPTAGVSFGQNGAETDFLAEQTCTNLAAQYDCIRCAPIEDDAVTDGIPVKTKSYAAGTVIVSKIVTQDADGGTASAYVFGTLY